MSVRHGQLNGLYGSGADPAFATLLTLKRKLWVMNRLGWRKTVAELATGQWGLFTTPQARQLGAPYSRLTDSVITGALTRIAYGVYRITGAPIHPHEELRAAWLALDPHRSAAERLACLDPGGVVSHRSAAWVHELGDIDADVKEFTVQARRRTRRPDHRFHVGHVAPGEWIRVDGLPVTSPLRTIADLAADRLDGGHLAGILCATLETGRATIVDVENTLKPHSRRYGLRRHDGQLLVEHLLNTSIA